MRRTEPHVFSFTFFYKVRAHYFLRWCFRVPLLELIYLLLGCPGGGKEIGTCLYHITVSWSVKGIGTWGISCVCKIGFSQVRSGLVAEWKNLIYDMTGTRLGHLSHHGVSPLLPKPGQPITLSIRLQSSQESSGVHPNPPSVYTHACNTQTHTLEISTNAEGGGGEWQTKRHGKGFKP